MFGHSSNNNQANGVQPVDPDPNLAPHEPETIAPSPAPIAPAPPVTENPIDDYVMTDLPHVAAPDKLAPVASPVASTPTVVSTDIGQPAVIPTGHSDASGDLLELKQSALHELSPLIGHLEQTPEEKFRTTMMMIQASDDQSMLQSAFAAAKDIKDEKARAQALLDVVNEINYFTQQHTDAA